MIAAAAISVAVWIIFAAVDTGTGQRAFWRVSRADLDAYISSKRAETARRFGAAS